MFYWIYMYVGNTLDEAFSHDSMKSKVCWHGGVAQHLILFLAAGGRDDWGCEEIINLHIESVSSFHNQTNSNSILGFENLWFSNRKCFQTRFTIQKGEQPLDL